MAINDDMGEFVKQINLRKVYNKQAKLIGYLALNR